MKNKLISFLALPFAVLPTMTAIISCSPKKDEETKKEVNSFQYKNDFLEIKGNKLIITSNSLNEDTLKAMMDDTNFDKDKVNIIYADKISNFNSLEFIVDKNDNIVYFYEVFKNIKSVILPNVVNFESSMFSHLKFLESVDMPKVKTIAGGGFAFTPNLHTVNIPNIEVLGEGVFWDTKSLQSIEMKNLKKFEPGLFSADSGIQKLKLPLKFKDSKDLRADLGVDEKVQIIFEDN